MLKVSATLNSSILEAVQKLVDCDSTIRIIRISIDRPEIYMQISSIKNTQKSILDLQHILPHHATRYSDVPKTIVYFDSVAKICTALALFHQWMRRLKYPVEASTWVSSYFSDMAEDDKTQISNDFQRLDTECSSPHILLATDAYGLGVDNPDVSLIEEKQANADKASASGSKE